MKKCKVINFENRKKIIEKKHKIKNEISEQDYLLMIGELILCGEITEIVGIMKLHDKEYII